MVEKFLWEVINNSRLGFKVINCLPGRRDKMLPGASQMDGFSREEMQSLKNLGDAIKA